MTILPAGLEDAVKMADAAPYDVCITLENGGFIVTVSAENWLQKSVATSRVDIRMMARAPFNLLVGEIERLVQETTIRMAAAI